MPVSTYSGNLLLDLLLRGQAPTVPVSVWLSLHTADPGNTGDNEVDTAAWPSYARQEPAQGGAIGTGFTAAANKHSENENEILFPGQDGAGDVTVTHFGLWDAETNGNLLFYGALNAARQLFPTDEIVVKATELDVQVT
jgi:hypothetical protein